MYTYNSGEFNTIMTVAYYYIMVSLMVLLNIGFEMKNKEKMGSLRNFIGKFLLLEIYKTIILKLFIGLLLNSVMSVLSFNNFDFPLMFGKVDEEKKQERMHRSKFWRQFVYNFMIICTNLG